ncbi:D-glycerate dehydrogenase [Geothrix sp. PMB-07]|uniref:2-hydroxyacid dehydrogenase n=1 Tax=Geothrix sp. PMB-07 TaxID=3068640 RepID=UPI0027418164|nr:D-glycerate dehydrogenase [Geothrix sp. PMB-07]WLT33009.1 D-glycerate dehydrogenase [Geothrix sp. PMB-07]
MSIRILSTSPLVGPALNELGTRFPELGLAAFRSPEWNAALPEAEALVVLLSEPITEADLEAAPKLKAIGTYSVGVNHLPLRACQARGIAVVNTPGVLTDATADIALALLLALTRRVAEGEALVRSGSWQGWAPDQLMGPGLAGKDCGILGSGPIGLAFARRAWALGMRPVFWDRDQKGGEVDFGAGRAPRLPLPDLLARSAVLSLHCPLTDQTRGLLDRSALEQLPTGAIIINTARGGIIDENAAIDLLEAGRLGGVGLDVYEGEPRLNPRWLQAPRAVLLPHLGSATVETREAMARLLCDGLAAALMS